MGPILEVLGLARWLRVGYAAVPVRRQERISKCLYHFLVERTERLRRLESGLRQRGRFKLQELVEYGSVWRLLVPSPTVSCRILRPVQFVRPWQLNAQCRNGISKFSTYFRFGCGKYRARGSKTVYRSFSCVERRLTLGIPRNKSSLHIRFVPAGHCSRSPRVWNKSRSGCFWVTASVFGTTSIHQLQFCFIRICASSSF